MLTPPGTYDELLGSFRWRIPELYNVGVDVCDRHADGTDRTALLYVDEARRCCRYSFDHLKELSNRFANVLVGDRLAPGDRVGILLPQMPATPIAHIAVFKVGAIAVPLFTLFGQDAIEFRLADSGAKAVVTESSGLPKVLAIRERLPDLKEVYLVDENARSRALPPGVTAFESALQSASPHFVAAPTHADNKALLIYTSGTTGNPKGALHAHRVLPGHLPGMELSHDFLPKPGDLCWTPADWAWIGGLLDLLLPSLHHAVPVLASRMRKFDPDEAMTLMAEHEVRNAFLPPTALRLMRQAHVRNSSVRLRTIASGGECLGEEMLAWGEETFGITINEFYGQTECNLVIGNDARLFPVRPGSMGRAVPGHDVRIVNDSGMELPRGEIGNIGIRRRDPVMFLNYWNQPDATERKFAADFLLTGDLGSQDDAGYFTFVGRSDDLINSAGYRMGPGEIEECLAKHRAVGLAAVVAVPDAIRREVVKAWIVLRPGYVPSDELARDIQEFVRVHLAAHEYPRQIAFTDALPLTATGKIMRRELRARG
jgi:acetyl-CoA synthetase